MVRLVLVATTFGLAAGAVEPAAAQHVARSWWGEWDYAARTFAPRGSGGGAIGSADDPVGDTFGVEAVQHDLTSFSLHFSEVSLIARFEFAGQVSPPPEMFGSVGQMEVDTDQNAATGFTGGAIQKLCPAPAAYGAEFVVIFGLVPGEEGFFPVVDVLDFRNFDPKTGPILAGSGQLHATSRSMTVTVPLAVLGGDDGLVDAQVGVGTLPEPTDCAPDGRVLTSTAVTATPALSAPAAMFLAALLLAVGLSLTLGRRRAAAEC